MGWQTLSLPKKNAVLYSPLKKVSLPAFAESEFGNPFQKGRSQIMGWQIPICQKERSSLKKVCLTAFAESEFGNPVYFTGNFCKYLFPKMLAI